MYQVSFPGTACRYYPDKDEQATKFALLVTLEKKLCACCSYGLYQDI